MNSAPITIVTCSHGPAAGRCRRLCQSIDRFVPTTIEHCIIVPRRDYPLFSDLHRGRRRVHVTEEVVPGNFRHLPAAREERSAPAVPVPEPPPAVAPRWTRNMAARLCSACAPGTVRWRSAA